MIGKQISGGFALLIICGFLIEADVAVTRPKYSRNGSRTDWNQPQRPCVRDDLRIKAGETEAAMGGVRVTPYIFTNISSSACTLNGYPNLVLLNQKGAVVRRATKQESDNAVVTATLEPGKTAWFNLDYNAGGAGYFGKPCPTYRRLRINAPGIPRSFVLRAEIQTCPRTNFEVSFLLPGLPE
jgi:hypothetical protein